jgi:ABC-type phosphate transport system permease subunit
MLERLRKPWPDHRAERLLGAVALVPFLAVTAMIVFVAIRAWPTLAHNDGLSWLGPGGNVDSQLGHMVTVPHPSAADFYLRAWPLLYGTLLITGIAMILALPTALLSSIFIVEFAPAAVRRLMIPVVRLLASVPSIIYGLLGALVLAPFVHSNIITSSEIASHARKVQLTGEGVGLAAVVLAVMITPIMVSLISDALAGVPNAWREGAAALGVHKLRATRAVSLRGIRPAIVAAAALACARALGEAVVIELVAGGRTYAPNLAEGPVALLEPARTLASAILANFEDLFGAPAVKSSLYAFALVLLFSAVALSVASYLIKLPLRKYQVKG